MINNHGQPVYEPENKATVTSYNMQWSLRLFYLFNYLAARVWCPCGTLKPETKRWPASWRNSTGGYL